MVGALRGLFPVVGWLCFENESWCKVKYILYYGNRKHLRERSKVPTINATLGSARELRRLLAQK